MELTSESQFEYVAARRVLLDALQAIGVHRSSVVLVGAQAVYHHVGAGDLAVAPMTTDADLALCADQLEHEPELYAAMLSAGFVPDTQPGTWRGMGDVCVDLMVAPHQGGRTGRAARAADLPPHRKGVARIARGLEPALVDHMLRVVGSMSADDARTYRIRIAGPSALVVAKIIKLRERALGDSSGAKGRLKAKDALDVYRLLRAVEFADLVAGFDRHLIEDNAAAISAEALAVLRDQGRTPDGWLPSLVAQALGGDRVAAASFAVLADELVAAMSGRPSG